MAEIPEQLPDELIGEIQTVAESAGAEMTVGEVSDLEDVEGEQ